MTNRVPLVKSSRGDVAVLIKPQVQTLTPGHQLFEGARCFPCTAPMGIAAATNRSLDFLQCEWRYRVGCSASISMEPWASGGIFPVSVLARAGWGPLLPLPPVGWSGLIYRGLWLLLCRPPCRRKKLPDPSHYPSLVYAKGIDIPLLVCLSFPMQCLWLKEARSWQLLCLLRALCSIYSGSGAEQSGWHVAGLNFFLLITLESSYLSQTDVLENSLLFFSWWK